MKYTLNNFLLPKSIYTIFEPLFKLFLMRRKTDPFSLEKVNRVLIVRLDEIGDVVMTGPLIREIRRNIPQGHITIVVKPELQHLVRKCKHIDEVLTYEWNVLGWGDPLKQGWKVKRLVNAVKLALFFLWRRRYDLALLPRWDVDAYFGSYITYLSGAKWRISYTEHVTEEKSYHNKGFDLFFNILVDDRSPKHEVEKNLNILKHIGGSIANDKLELWIDEKDIDFYRQTLIKYKINKDRLRVGIGLGAGAAQRIWPLENYIKLGSWIIDSFNADIFLLGGKTEKEMGREFENSIPQGIVNLIGKTTLSETGAILNHCQLFVGNDSGSMHLAAAAGIPILEISCFPQNGHPSHYNSPSRFGPWLVPHVIIQPQNLTPPCKETCVAQEAHCIKAITLENVKKGFIDLFGLCNY